MLKEAMDLRGSLQAPRRASFMLRMGGLAPDRRRVARVRSPVDDPGFDVSTACG